MEAVAMFVALISVIVIVDLVAWRWGVDSRDTIADDRDELFASGK